MAKKKEEDKRTKLIKILVTERFYKKLNRYAGIVFQNKSEFIRTAIRHRISEIDNSIFSIPMDRKYKDQNLRRSVLKELKDIQKNTDYLQKPNEDSLKIREEEKKKRNEDLENEKKRLEKRLEVIKKNLEK
ncbi:MAG: DUF5320 domain-containing protein [Promethearchaeota archaeon]|nr:MAG: DUF5320 domain-containing protein [Candidatus Lokiarchaeota archaeon]